MAAGSLHRRTRADGVVRFRRGRARRRRGRHPRRRRAGRRDRLSPGAVRVTLLLPGGGHRLLRFGRVGAWADDRTVRRSCARAGGGDRRPDLRTADSGAVPQHGGGHRCDGRYLLGTYRKMHIPDDPQFFEKFYFTPGDLGYPVFETRYARVGVLICWDQWYPEAARLMALGGAELICYPTAIAWPAAGPGPDGEAERDAWRTVQRGHAIANGVWVASVNRVGVEASEAGGLRVLGRIVHLRSARAGHHGGVGRAGGGCRTMRTRAGGAATPRLAVPSRPADRYLRGAARTIPRRRSMSAWRAGVRVPAEWKPHEATWLVWPHNRDDWRVKTAAVEWCYADMIRHLVPGERVALVCQDARVRRRAFDRLARSGVDTARVDTHLVPTNRSWIRDSGPIFVVRDHGARRTVVATDWRFTGWSRYRAHQLDDALPCAIAHRLGMERIEVCEGGARVVLEGGQHRRQRRGAAADHRELPARERAAAQSGIVARDDRASARPDARRPHRSSGCRAASATRRWRGTTRMGMSTTSRASSDRRPSWWRWRRNAIRGMPASTRT